MEEKDLMLEVVKELYNIDGHQMTQEELFNFIGDPDDAIFAWNFLPTIDGCMIIPIGEGNIYLDTDKYYQVVGKINQYYEQQTRERVDKAIDIVSNLMRI